MKKFLLATAVTVAIVAPAQAADLPVKAPPPAAVVVVDSWSGFYIGAHGGWQRSHVNVQNPAFPPGFDFRHSSAVFGGQVGLQKQFGQFVLGIEGDFTWVRRNTDTVTCFAPGPQLIPGGTGLCNTRPNNIWSVGPRIGWAASNQWMPYVTGGWASTKYNFEGRTNANVLNEVASARLNGWFIGGGIDVQVYQNLVLGVEYRHYDFRSKTVNATTVAGVFLEQARFGDARADSITARLSYKFNPWGSPVVARY